MVLLHHFGNMYAKNEHESLNRSFNIYELFYFTMITIIFSCTMCLIIPFVKVYTIGIVDVNYVRPLFACLIVIAEYMWAIRQPYSGITLAVGHFKETRKGAWVETLTNIVVSSVLVVKLGLVGVAIGTLVAMTIRTIEFMYHSAKYILKRKQINGFLHLGIASIEITTIYFIVNCIIKKVVFTSYIVWMKYAIISAIISSIITIGINCAVYRNETKGIIDIIKKNLKRKEV